MRNKYKEQLPPMGHVAANHPQAAEMERIDKKLLPYTSWGYKTLHVNSEFRGIPPNSGNSGDTILNYWQSV